MRKQLKGIAETAPVIGVVVFASTMLFALIYWMGDIIAAMEAVPGAVLIGILGTSVAVSAAAAVWGGEAVRALGTVGLLAAFWSIGFALALTLPEYLAPYIIAALPAWPPVVWLALGVGTAVVLVGGGVASHWWVVKA